MSGSLVLPVAFLTSAGAVLALSRVAQPVGLVDVPTMRKVHEGSVPLTGGIAIFTAFVVGILLSGGIAHAPWDLLAGLSVLVVIGVADDLVELRAHTKLAGQIVAVMVMIVPEWRVVSEIPDPLGGGAIELHGLAFPFTLALVVGLVNAFNMLDGLDGLAGGAAAAAFFWLGVVVAAAGSGERSGLLILLFATGGFLLFNMRHPWRSRAAAFLGDAGSMTLGACVAYYLVALNGRQAGDLGLAALLWIVVIPATDTVGLIIRRLAAGRSPLAADREHLHHLLLEDGLSPRAASALLMSAGFVLGGIGVLGGHFGVPDTLLLWGLVVVALGQLSFGWRRARMRLRRATMFVAPPAEPITEAHGA